MPHTVVFQVLVPLHFHTDSLFNTDLVQSLAVNFPTFVFGFFCKSPELLLLAFVKDSHLIEQSLSFID